MKGGKPKPNQVNALETAVQAGIQRALAAQPVDSPETYAFGAFYAFTIHYDETEATTDELSQQSQQNQDPKLRPEDPESYHLSGLPAQPQVAKTNSNTSVKTPMPHMEFDPYIDNPVQTTLRLSPRLPVALRLHEETYVRLNAQRPTAHPQCRPQVGHITMPPEVNTQAVADTGAHMDILSLASLKSLGFDPKTIIKVQVKVTSSVRGSQLDIRGGIFLSVCSPGHSNHHKTVRLF